ncbi:hypothetical protein AX14_008216 [Amanita brunnescens Koide BX004]|nr:hypothetical protein AX14_008216 [Amanita brunnescens Koide BX004]
MAQPAQPNFQILSDNLTAACDEIVLTPNMPIGQLAAAVVQQTQQQAQQQAQQHAAVLDALAQINATLAQLNARFDQLPMQLRNATASLEAPLAYPHGIQIGAAFPGTKSALLRLSVANCITVAQALGLPALPLHTTVVNRRQQIIDFLGCVIVAH